MPREFGFRSFDDEMKERFGCKVYRLSLDGGMCCPNRDGTVGTGGCIFCSAKGSGEFATDRTLPISEQLIQAKKKVSAKVKNGKYMAYFQNFTNTYAPVSYLRRIFYEALEDPEVCALSVATRPDCLEEDKLALLEEISYCVPVWVELGLQTVWEETASYIRRNCPLELFGKSVRELESRGIHTVLHCILGLPGETPDMMLETVRYVAHSGCSGVKFHLLHVLEGTDLAEEYLQGKFRTLELEEYIGILEKCVEILPPEMTIHRLTGDGDKKILLAPLWSGNKKLVLNTIHRRFQKDGVFQGRNHAQYVDEK